ncbi:xylulose kinase [Cylas formicarius]|uniref:xylulose kinase n=1 Tax=Cylas formicarius TaxID=197179 RepID=UPI002958A67A|nr:xylulose kinase [Cylas formicarius]
MAEDNVTANRTFLGFDLSTQQLKVAALNDNLEVLHEAHVKFDTDLPEFRTQGGAVIDKSDHHRITAPTLMWVKAVDMVLDRLMMAGVDFSTVAAISGSAQQHGSVYWQKGASQTLLRLNPDEFLHQQLAHCFSVPDGPIWMDGSTAQQCRQLEAAVGGAEMLAAITGSRAYERFTGAQIAKIYQTKPDAYKNTERISLVSSFLATIFLGRMAPIDLSDGSGMNLMDIGAKRWHPGLLDACAPGLEERLGDPVPSNTVLGPVSPYFVDRYNFNPDCRVVAFTGDNPASLMGMRLGEGWFAVSLGTSDTAFLWLKDAKVVPDGHVLRNPVDENSFMALLCFENGSLTRERVRNACAERSWDIFNQLLDSTPRGNFGNLGLYYDVQEILPKLEGDFRYNKTQRVAKFTSLEVEVRACVEGQFIAKRAYAEDFGFDVGRGTKILATGGASKNKAILQVLADVFNSPVYVQKVAESAMLGAAYQAKHGLTGENWERITASLPEPVKVCDPYPDADEIYAPMTLRYRHVVQELLDEKSSKLTK